MVADITTAIKGSAKAGVAHRDITPNNFGHIDGRGFLYDFSAGKVSAQATQICHQTLDGVLTYCSWHQSLHLTSQQELLLDLACCISRPGWQSLWVLTVACRCCS